MGEEKRQTPRSEEADDRMTAKTPVLAAVDIGGTKTLAVLFAPDGRILHRFDTHGLTPVDAPIEVCTAHYASVLPALCRGAGLTEPPDAAYFSIACTEHYSGQYFSAVRASTDAARLRVEPDGLCLISAMLGHQDGASIICGTGSSLYVRRGESFHRIGGWGHYIDSCGSGFVLGRLAIRAALRAHDGRDGPTVLTERIGEKLGYPIWEDYANIYSKGRPYVASFASCVFEARRAGDRAAQEIFESCSADLAELISTAYREGGGAELTVVFNGGIFTHFPEYAEAVRAKAPAAVRAVFSDVPPVYGCAVEALHDLGLVPDAAFRANFLSTL